MQLQLESMNIQAVKFGERSEITGRTLYLNRGDLLTKIHDEQLINMDIQIAEPGESCRISHVGDVIEPRVKAGDPDSTFPGSAGKLVRAGDGVTRCLKGVTVMETYQMPVPQYSLVDMKGNGAQYTVFSKTYNIVLTAYPAEETDKYQYAAALKKASLALARYLAELSLNIPADEINIYELKEKPGCDLPRVVYIHQLFSHKHNVEPLLYGDDCFGILPTLVHPNEILDGAIINRNYEQLSNGEATYTMQNHPVILDLYARDGADLDFAGVILLNSSSELVDKRRSAMMAATQAKYYLKADLAIISKEGGGHPQLDMAFCCDYLAEYGIKTVMLITELMTTGNGGANESIIFNTPNADAIVSTGSFENIELDEVERVIGGDVLPGVNGPLNGRIVFPNRYIRGALSQIGDSWVRAVEY